MAYETVPLQQLLREIAARTASEQDADAIRLAADTLDDYADEPWISVADSASLPPFGEDVLVWVPYVGMYSARRLSFGGRSFQHRIDAGLPGDWCWKESSGSCSIDLPPTHWMRRPAPPQEAASPEGDDDE